MVDVHDRVRLFVEKFVDAVDFGEQQCFGVFGKTETERFLNDADHAAIEHFHGGGEQAGADDFGDGGRCIGG